MIQYHKFNKILINMKYHRIFKKLLMNRLVDNQIKKIILVTIKNKINNNFKLNNKIYNNINKNKV